jgi:hypothetical protein
MWAVWQQMTDTRLAWLYHQDTQRLQELGLDGIISCQSFRVFYPTGMAMSALAESLWNPDVPWEEMRGRFLEAAYAEHASYVGEYLDKLEGFLDTGDPHWRTPPLSNADERKLADCAAFLELSLLEFRARHDAALLRAPKKSLELLAYHAQVLQYIVRGYQARLAGNEAQAEREFDEGIAFLKRTEPRYSGYVDTMLALRYVEQAKQYR